MAPELELAWAAGFWDGEGCTTLLRKKRKDGTENISVRLSIGQKDVRALERFRRAIGTERQIGPVQQSGVSYLHINAQAEARRVLDLLWPYLGEAKREQAERRLAESTWQAPREGPRCGNPEHEMKVYVNGRRRCKQCTKKYQDAYNAKRRTRLCG
jgi:hypothetical protein